MNVCHPCAQDEPDGRWDAVDGGTTATVVALVRGETAYIAMVGDSSVLLLGRDPKTDSPTHRVLLDEHSPTSLAEYERILKLPSAAAGVRFVYECPDFEEFPIFGTDGAGAPALSGEGLASASPNHIALCCGAMILSLHSRRTPSRSSSANPGLWDNTTVG